MDPQPLPYAFYPNGLEKPPPLGSTINPERNEDLSLEGGREAGRPSLLL